MTDDRDTIGVRMANMLIAEFPGIKTAEPRDVARAMSILATSLAGVLTGVLIHQGEATAQAVGAMFIDDVNSEVRAISGKVVTLLNRETRH